MSADKQPLMGSSVPPAYGQDNYPYNPPPQQPPLPPQQPPPPYQYGPTPTVQNNIINQHTTVVVNNSQQRGRAPPRQPGGRSVPTPLVPWKPPDYIAVSICMMMTCCPLVALFALIVGVKSNTAYRNGNFDEALRFSKCAKRLNIAAVLAGIASFVAACLILLLVEVIPIYNS